MAGPAIWSHLSELYVEEKRGKIIGIGMAFFSLGQVLGVPLASLLADFANWRLVFLIICLGILICDLSFLVYNHFIKNFAESMESRKNIFNIKLFKDNKILIPLICTFLFQMASLGTYTYLGEIMHQKFDLGISQLGFLGIMVGAGSIIGSLISGRLFDLLRMRKRGWEYLLTIFCTILLLISMLSITIINSLTISLLFIVLWFISSGAFTSLQQVLLTLIAPKDKGTLISFNNSVMYLGTAIGVSVMAYAYANNINIVLISILVSALSFIISLQYLIIFRRVKNEQY